MKRMWFVSAAALVAALLVAGGQATAWQAGQSKAEQEVRRLEREWLDAYEKNDAGAMDRIVAEGFTITFPNGSVQTKAQLMGMIRAPRKGAPPKFHTEAVESRAYGDTVILTGRVVAEFQQDGKTVRDVSRYTDTYVRVGGRWQVVASHLSAAGEPRPAAP
ncbi:MAG TPA: nuclear transport factor 2 family protein [Pyrinomonadaceae bacterium]|nr:nuclear transport factor 2 family protein [Pyrinomonadaceae bacterium]